MDNQAILTISTCALCLIICFLWYTTKMSPLDCILWLFINKAKEQGEQVKKE